MPSIVGTITSSTTRTHTAYCAPASGQTAAPTSVMMRAVARKDNDLASSRQRASRTVYNPSTTTRAGVGRRDDLPRSTGCAINGLGGRIAATVEPHGGFGVLSACRFGRTSEATSTGELLSTLRATDEIHQVDPRTWAVPSGAPGFHLPGVRGGRDQRGRAGYSSIVKTRQVTEPCIARRSASPAKSRGQWASLSA